MKHHDFPPRSDWHAYGCTCRSCEPNLKPVDRLTGNHIGVLAIAAAIVVTLIMLAIDPAGTIATWKSVVGR